MNKRKAIIDKAVSLGGFISKKEAVETIGRAYYCNKEKHTGDVLHRMVQSGVLERVKHGLYKVIRGESQARVKPIDKNQASLF